MVFVFSPIYVIKHIYLFMYVEPTLHPKDETNLIMMDKLSDVLLHLVCQYFTKDFCIDVHQGYWTEVSFLVVSLPGFAMRMMLAS